MCGIAGIYCFDPKREVKESVVGRMADTMMHRGPDDSGTRVGAGYGLGHRRLSIIDVKGGRQPIANENGRTWIIVNGEIYNYRDLAPELETAGHVFRTGSDSEVALHGHEEWGGDAVKRLLGMFAYAIVDEDTRSLTLVRDHLGIKPLYWTVFDNCILFASEIKAILAYPGFETSLNESAISSYLHFRYVINEQTFFKNIHEIPPGHQLVGTPDGISIEPYWEIPHEKDLEDRGERFYIEHVKETIDSAVRYRMMSDVPIGAFLSGGVDSSLIVALMARHSKSPINTFSTGFREEGYNEFYYARLVADRYATVHREIVNSDDDYFDLLPQLVKFKDAPLGVPNEVPLWRMSDILKKDVTVVLSGEGADELLGGYGRIFRSAYDYERMKAGVSGSLHEEFIERYGRADYSAPVGFFLHLYSYFGDENLKRFLNSDFQYEFRKNQYPRSVFEKAFEYVGDLSLQRRFFWIFQRYHLPGLLQRLDTTTMAASVEARVPFVDHRLVELGQRIPAHYKLRWKSRENERQAKRHAADRISEVHDTPKWLLRQVARDLLPERIISRSKMGFPVPLGHWLGGRLMKEARDRLLDPSAATSGLVNKAPVLEFLKGEQGRTWADGMRIWMLLNLEIFLSQNKNHL
jgi:asparagine synthase (glutamine-hydrolysing)